MRKGLACLLLCQALWLIPATPAGAEVMPAPGNPVLPPPPTPTPPTVSPDIPYWSGNNSSYADSRERMRAVGEASLRLTQSLWEGGATEAQIAVQRARLTAAGNLLQDALTSLAFDAIACHVDVLRRRDMVVLARQNVRDHEAMLTMLQSRVRDGLAGVGDVRQVESRLARARGSLAEYQAYLQATEATFWRITGQRAPQALDAVPLPRTAYTSVQQAGGACVERNPRLRAAMDEINATEGERWYARSRDFPSFALETGPRLYMQDTDRDRTRNGFDAMLVMRWNLYDGGATTAAKNSADAKKRQSRQTLHRIRDILAEDIEATWARYESAGEQAEWYGQSMKAAKAARSAFHEQYMLGSRSLLDLLDADNDYFTSASQHMVARGDRIISAYRLLALGGDLLTELGVNPDAVMTAEPVEPPEYDNLSRTAQRQPAGKPPTPKSTPEPKQLTYMVQEPTPASAQQSSTPQGSHSIHGIKGYAWLENGVLACKVSLRNPSGTPATGAMRAALVEPSGAEQPLEVTNPDFQVRHGLEKRFSAALPSRVHTPLRVRLWAESEGKTVYDHTFTVD